MVKLCGYTGKILKVDLSNEFISMEERLDQAKLRKLAGGTGFVVKMMYEEVLGGFNLLHPENRLIGTRGVSTETDAPANGIYGMLTWGHSTRLFAASLTKRMSLGLPMILTKSKKWPKTAVQEDGKWL